MRRVIAVVFVVLLAAPLAFAVEGGNPAQGHQTQTTGNEAITHGEFAQMVMDIALGYEEATPDPVTALEQMKAWGIVPVDWNASHKLTHGELAYIVGRVGIDYLPPRPNAHVSRVWLTAFLWREVGKLRDYMASRLGHNLSANHVLDAGVDRAVSPSDFD